MALKGPNIRPRYVFNGFGTLGAPLPSPAMSLFIALSRTILSRIGLLLSFGDERHAEILALHHQLRVLQRQINRPHFTN